MGKNKNKKAGSPVKGKKAPPQPTKVSEDESEDEETTVKTIVAKNTKKQPAKKAGKNKKQPPAPPPKDSDDSSEEDSEEEEKQKPKKNAKAAAPKNKAPAKEDSDDDSSEEESDDEDEKPKVQQKKIVQPAQKKKADSDDDDDESDEDSDQEEKPVKAVAKKTEDSEDDSSDDESEEEKPAKKVNGKAKESSEDEDDSDEDSDDSSLSKKRKAEAQSEGQAKKQKVSEEASKNEKKRKQQNEDETPAKKQKTAANGEQETHTLFIGNVENLSEMDVGNFLSENDVTVLEARKVKANCFVDVSSAEDVDKALALSGEELNGHTLRIDKAKPKTPRQNTQQNRSFSSRSEKDEVTMFVKNLPEDVSENGLAEIFDNAADIRIPRADGFSKGYAFIEFNSKDELEEAMSNKQGADLNGSSLYLDYTGSKSSFQKGGNDRTPRGGRGRDRGGFNRRGGFNADMKGTSKVLFVKNLSFNTDENSLRDSFEGAVSARIPTYQDSGKPKGFAFVDFESPEAAAEAYDSMNGQSIDGRQVTLDFAADKNDGGGRGGRGGGRGFGGGRGRGRGFGDRGRGGRGRGRGRGGFVNKEKGGILQAEGKKMTFDDSD